MKKIKMLVLLITIVALMSTAACSGKSNTGTTSTTSAGTTAIASTSAAPQEEYVIKVLFEGGKTVDRSDLQEAGKVIKEKFNIIFEWVPFAGNYIEYSNTLLASGEYPELMIIRGNDQVKNFIKAGALLPLDDYLKGSKYFTETYKVLIPFWRMIAPDNKLYKWETNVLRTVGVPTEVAVRSDLLEEQGWPLLRSTKDYIDFLKVAKEKHPTVDGKPSFGMVFPGADIAGIWFPRIVAFTGDTYFQVNNDHNIVYNLKTQQYENYLNQSIKESLKFFNDLHQAGILDDECFTDTYEILTQKLKTGQAFSYINSRYGGVDNKALIDSGHPEMQYISMPIQLASQVEKNEKALTVTSIFSAYESVVMTKNAKYPERIFQVLDWAASDEGQLLIQSGVEGVDYLRDENGIRYRTEEMWTNWQNPEYVLKIGTWQFKTLIGRIATSPVDGQAYGIKKVTNTDRIKEALNKYGWTETSGWFNDKNSFVYAALFDSMISIDPASETGRLGIQIKELINNEQTGLIRASSNDEFERLWTKLMNDYNKLNPKSFTDAYNAELVKVKSAIDKIK
ncbi:MAG: extracellular solute-binding protein [Ruminiclostridium sp.]|nr:extracellular solute-binding protein [Ruminiclostridium sp.]